MTMRHPLDGELTTIKPTFDPDKSYRFTWPGQPPRVVSGAELAAIVRGADHTMLEIEEAEPAPHDPKSV